MSGGFPELDKRTLHYSEQEGNLENNCSANCSLPEKELASSSFKLGELGKIRHMRGVATLAGRGSHVGGMRPMPHFSSHETQIDETS